MRLRSNLVLIPDVAVFYPNEPARVPDTPPLLIAEVLSLDDRLTASAVGSLLLQSWRDPDMRAVIWDALPLAGVSGTLQNRLLTGPAHAYVRAKTGTTDQASALSGYAGDRFAFSILQNGAPVSFYWARLAQDRVATALSRVATEN